MQKDVKVILRDGGTFTILEEQILFWESIYSDLNVRDEINYLKEMWENETMPRKTAKNINKFINKWLSKQSKEDL